MDHEWKLALLVTVGSILGYFLGWCHGCRVGGRLAVWFHHRHEHVEEATDVASERRDAK